MQNEFLMFDGMLDLCIEQLLERFEINVVKYKNYLLMEQEFGW